MPTTTPTPGDEPGTVRSCVQCGTALPADANRNKRYCGDRCRQAAMRARSVAADPHDIRVCAGCRQAKLQSEFTSTRNHCKECRAAASRLRYRARAEYDHSAEAALATRYRLTLEEYNAIAERQHDRCLVCDQPETATRSNAADQTRFLEVDRHPTTGEVRGLLCLRCTRVMTALREAPGLMDRVAAYLADEEPGRVYRVSYPGGGRVDFVKEEPARLELADTPGATLRVMSQQEWDGERWSW